MALNLPQSSRFPAVGKLRLKLLGFYVSDHPLEVAGNNLQILAPVNLAAGDRREKRFVRGGNADQRQTVTLKRRLGVVPNRLDRSNRSSGVYKP